MLNVITLIFSSAPSRPSLDDCRDCPWRYRLTDRHILAEVLENGEHGGQLESHHDSVGWDHASPCRLLH